MSSQFPTPKSLQFSTSKILIPEIRSLLAVVVGASEVGMRPAMQMTSAGPAVSRAKPDPWSSMKTGELISAQLDAFP